jgi:benzoate/toluate 1,2-dioxygenase reductase subunit
MANIALNFEDGVTRIIEGLPGETIAESAYRLGINIPLDCADGACGTCKCMCLSGDYDPGDYIEDALSDDEAANGFGLACQIRPETNMVIEILASSTACKVKVESFSTTIKEIAFLSEEVIKLSVNINDGTALNFLPGQYVNIEIPGTGITRSYSFSNLTNTNQLTFLIKLVNDGTMSNYLTNEAKIGDTLQLTGPLGSFYLRDLQQPSLFFAGGTGIAPFIAMLEKLSLAEVKHPVHLFYGATNEPNLVELELLENFKSEIPLTIYTCVSNESCEKHPSGFVTQWINKEHLQLANYDVYICGPNVMVESVKNALETEDITYLNFYMEKFVPTGNPVTT